MPITPDLRDAVLIAMLEHPERAHDIAEWAADESNLSGLTESLGSLTEDEHGPPPRPGLVFDQAKHRWVRPAAAGGDGTGAGPRTSEGAEEGGHLPAPVRGKFRRLLAAAASVPGAVKEKVAGAVKRTYEKLEAKYGKTGARLVLGGMVALMPVPVPGTSVLPIAIAEGIKRLGNLFGKRAESLHEAEQFERPAFTPEDLAAAIRESLAELYAGSDAPAPDMDDEELCDLAAELLADADHDAA